MKTSLPPFVHSFPAPAVLIGSGTVQKPNLITISWIGTCCSEPPMITIGVRRNRYSYKLIHDSGEFTVNLPRTSEVETVKFCGNVSGQDVEKFAALKATPTRCEPLESAPMIVECFLSLGCKVRHELELGTHNLFVAEVVGVHGTEQRGHPQHRPEMFVSEQMVFLDGRYWGLKPLE